MAISLGFGILFGTVIILTIVPSVYLIVEDFLGNRRDLSEEKLLTGGTENAPDQSLL